jgi:ribonuclease M5
MKIGELIVVEGKDDVAAVKRAVEADVIITGGFGIKSELIVTLRAAVRRTGVIILTDPDSAGNKIRSKLNGLVPGCKNAYLPQREGIKGKDIGIENACPDAIVRSLLQVKPEQTISKSCFSLKDLIEHGLAAVPDAVRVRKRVGSELGIGETNAKQFLSRLNNQGISREEFIAALNKIRED